MEQWNDLPLFAAPAVHKCVCRECGRAMPERPAARANDKATSNAGAADVFPRRSSQQARVLETYIRQYFGEFPVIGGLTNYEAGKFSGLADRPGCCYWKRCSELLEKGWIAPTGTERQAPTGSMQAVHQVTDAGRRAYFTIHRGR